MGKWRGKKIRHHETIAERAERKLTRKGWRVIKKKEGERL